MLRLSHGAFMPLGPQADHTAAAAEEGEPARAKDRTARTTQQQPPLTASPAPTREVH